MKAIFVLVVCLTWCEGANCTGKEGTEYDRCLCDGNAICLCKVNHPGETTENHQCLCDLDHPGTPRTADFHECVCKQDYPLDTKEAGKCLCDKTNTGKYDRGMCYCDYEAEADKHMCQCKVDILGEPTLDECVCKLDHPEILKDQYTCQCDARHGKNLIDFEKCLCDKLHENGTADNKWCHCQYVEPTEVRYRCECTVNYTEGSDIENCFCDKFPAGDNKDMCECGLLDGWEKTAVGLNQTRCECNVLNRTSNGTLDLEACVCERLPNGTVKELCECGLLDGEMNQERCKCDVNNDDREKREECKCYLLKDRKEIFECLCEIKTTKYEQEICKCGYFNGTEQGKCECGLLPTWWMQDRCKCDRNVDQEACDVYCKQPYLDSVKCRNVSEMKGDDKWLCLYSNVMDNCVEYCNHPEKTGMSVQECTCKYVLADGKLDPICKPYCDEDGEAVASFAVLNEDGKKMRRDECGCKFHRSDSPTPQTEDCYFYCDRFQTETEREACKCKYLSNSTSCEFGCNLMTDQYRRQECLCKLEKDRDFNATLINETCDPLSKYIEDYIAMVDEFIPPEPEPEPDPEPEPKPEQEPEQEPETESTRGGKRFMLSESMGETNTTNTTGEGEGEGEEAKLLHEAIEALAMAQEALALSKCYYSDIAESCKEYCGYMNGTEFDDGCKCNRLKYKDSCLKQCEDAVDDEFVYKQCRCMVDSDLCTDFCVLANNATGLNETEREKSWQLQDCICSYSSTGSRACERFCTVVFEGDDNVEEEAKLKKDNRVLCESHCSTVAVVHPNGGYHKCLCDIIQDPVGCDVYCHNISLLNVTEVGLGEVNHYKAQCRKFCNQMGSAEPAYECRCNYTDEYLCRDYCLIERKGRPEKAYCEMYCDSLKTGKERNLCKCKFLNTSYCQRWCYDHGAQSAIQDCLCDIGQDPPCKIKCEALGDEGRVVDRARCLCRSKINITACTDYCNMALVGQVDADLLQNKCKCDYEQGEQYCTQYSHKLPTDKHLLLECTKKGNKTACYDYCYHYVAVNGNLTATYQCWCETYGDAAYCPAFCDIVDWNARELMRCKCLHYTDNPSCEQYCTMINDDDYERNKCQCLLMHETAEGKMIDKTNTSHYTGCVNYCRSLPTYGERVNCSCTHKLDQARCAEIGALISGSKPRKPPQSELYWPKCNVHDGKAHELNCNFYCNSLWWEEMDRNNDTAEAEKVLLTCKCDVLRKPGSCLLYCNKYFNETTGTDGKQTDPDIGKYKKCLCEHGGHIKNCEEYCDYLYRVPDHPKTANDYRIEINNSECKCDTRRHFNRNATTKAKGEEKSGQEMFDDALEMCNKTCERKYGDPKEMPWAACYLEYDKVEYNRTFCERFKNVATKSFCHCFYEPKPYDADLGRQIKEDDNCKSSSCKMKPVDDCKDYCDKLAVSTEDKDEGIRLSKMCKCYGGNDSACDVFCEPTTYSTTLCRRYCATMEGNDKIIADYMKCQCVAQVTAGCVAHCDTFYNAEETDSVSEKKKKLEEYYRCRCMNKLDIFSCERYCEYNKTRNPSFEPTGRCPYGDYTDFQKCVENEEDSYESCMYQRVYLGAGDDDFEGKRYQDDYDTDDQLAVLADFPWVEVEGEEEEEEEKKREEVKDEEVQEEEEEEEEEELVVEEPLVEEPKPEGWFENKTNRMIVIISGSVFIVVLVVAVVVIIVIYLRRKNNAVGKDEAKEIALDSVEKEEEPVEPSYINDYENDEQKRNDGGPHSTTSPAPRSGPSAGVPLFSSVHNPSDDSNYE